MMMQRAQQLRAPRAGLARPVPTPAAVGRPQRQVLRAAAAEVDTKAKEGAKVEDDTPEVLPTTQQVESLLSTIVSETEIVEMHLQVGSFELKVKRSIKSAAPPPPPPPPAPVAAPVTFTPSPRPPAEALALEESIDESLTYVTSPKVGIFRRGRYAGGKRVGKGNIINVGDQVKKGQTLGFVEQLGTFVAVEAPQAGEVVKFVAEDGSPVEYQQLVVEMAPFFGGHIIGDQKYA